jgi:hypothetical protein
MSEYAATTSAQQSVRFSDDEQRAAPIVFYSPFTYVHANAIAMNKMVALQRNGELFGEPLGDLA